MSFRWFKPYMPRSLYGRVALILLLPVITLMLVVSVIAFQRNFNGVTGQMVTSVSREVQLMAASGMDVDEMARSTMAETLEINLREIPLSDVPTQDFRRWYDLTGPIVIQNFRGLLPNVKAISLPDDQQVLLYFIRNDVPVELSFDRRRVSPSNPHQLLVNMVVFSVFMTVVAYIYLKNQLRPITRLAYAAEAFGRGRIEEYRPGGATEVRAAGNAFLDMRARIERQIEQRVLMLSGVSHDLRTPLTRLKLGLSMMDEKEAALMQKDVQEMERLIEAFLDFARGAQEGSPEKIQPIDFVTEIVADSQRAGQDVTLISTVGSGQVALRKNALKRAVENLINNGVRYGNKVEVSVALTERSLRIRVEDDGPGIPAEQREKATMPFVRLDAARNQNLGSGVGLGLSIAMDVARAHGGTLRLGESQTLGGLCADIVIAR